VLNRAPLAYNRQVQSGYTQTGRREIETGNASWLSHDTANRMESATVRRLRETHGVPQLWKESTMAINTEYSAPEMTVAAQDVRGWMSTPAITITPDTPLSEALAVMHEHSIRRLPVVLATGQICGIVTDGDIRGVDLLRLDGIRPDEIAAVLRQTPVYAAMTERPIVTTPTTTLREAALLMLDNKVGGLPIVDEHNTVLGMITESDLFEALVCFIDRTVEQASPTAHAAGARGRYGALSARHIRS
jgi:acetoin utilization protein AcuB/CBS domain-containing protein